VPRRARPGDIGILFRTRESHREFEQALEARGIPAYVYKGLGFFDADEIKDSLALLWYLADPASDLRAAAFLRSRVVGLSDEALRRLAPRLADALRAAAAPPAAAGFDSHDRDALERARTSTARWRGLVDRLPPAELFDLVLAESAYGLELRGPRLQQARENLKKMRALSRRIQNRGYATLARIAAHVDRLSTGDESNAVIDALDAVNLMTVHAAKGLEFPIVFVVNLARGTGNRRDPVRVTTGGGEDRNASVSVGDFQSEVDSDSAAREREETKRLLYVALTRARDRLYLGSVLKDGELQPGRGSLAEVLPATLAALFSEVGSGTDDFAEWRASSGATHRFFRLKPEATLPPEGGSHHPGEDHPDEDDPGEDHRALVASGFSRKSGFRLQAEAPEDDFEPLIDAIATPRLHATTAAGAPAAASRTQGGDSDRLAGILVHRLLERFGFAAIIATDDVERALPMLLDPDELVDVIDRRELAARAAAGYAGVCHRADVQALCASGERLHEVPFTMATANGIVRGTIDCLVRGADGSIAILEFKTGRARPEHQVQLDLYTQAAARLFPSARIEALLVYAEDRHVVTG
jgi:ATP-dependent exoDNAse (exonuclease V) beta subunit